MSLDLQPLWACTRVLRWSQRHSRWSTHGLADITKAAELAGVRLSMWTTEGPLFSSDIRLLPESAAVEQSRTAFGMLTALYHARPGLDMCWWELAVRGCNTTDADLVLEQFRPVLDQWFGADGALIIPQVSIVLNKDLSFVYRPMKRPFLSDGDDSSDDSSVSSSVDDLFSLCDCL